MKKLLSIFTFLLVFILPAIILAQPPGLPDDPEQSPIGGIAILAAAGGAYAIKKLHDREKEV